MKVLEIVCSSERCSVSNLYISRVASCWPNIVLTHAGPSRIQCCHYPRHCPRHCNIGSGLGQYRRSLAIVEGYCIFGQPQTSQHEKVSNFVRVCIYLFIDTIFLFQFTCPLWNWAITSAENNTEFKLWSCKDWKCRFQSTDSTPIVQKMALDLSASFLVISDIHRRV